MEMGRESVPISFESLGTSSLERRACQRLGSLAGCARIQVLGLLSALYGVLVAASQMRECRGESSVSATKQLQG